MIYFSHEFVRTTIDEGEVLYPDGFDAGCVPEGLYLGVAFCDYLFVIINNEPVLVDMRLGDDKDETFY